jgi:REP element-mobilizing transposase RayT
MEDKYKNKFRIASNRLQGWNYANNGHYYITIVTSNRINFFGNIENNEMIMNDVGQIVSDVFLKSFEIRRELILGSYILMPNHLHAIVIIDKPHTINPVETHGRASLQRQGQSHLIRAPRSISSFIAGFKSSTIKHIDNWIDQKGLSMQKFNRNNPLWQANYYDHLIRNHAEYQRIALYIENNPAQWCYDKMNPAN